MFVEGEESVDASGEGRQSQVVFLQRPVTSAVGLNFNTLQLLRIPRMEDVLNSPTVLQQLLGDRSFQFELLVRGHRKH